MVEDREGVGGGREGSGEGGRRGMACLPDYGDVKVCDTTVSWCI